MGWPADVQAAISTFGVHSILDSINGDKGVRFEVVTTNGERQYFVGWLTPAEWAKATTPRAKADAAFAKITPELYPYLRNLAAGAGVISQPYTP